MSKNNKPKHRFALQPDESKTVPVRLEQLRSYLKVADDLKVLPIIYIGLTSGLRQCELFALQWADFDVKNRCILRGERVLILSEKAVELLMKEGQRHPDSTYIFINPQSDKPYQLQEFYYLHRKILKRARLHRVAFRGLMRLCQESEI